MTTMARLHVMLLVHVQ